MGLALIRFARGAHAAWGALEGEVIVTPAGWQGWTTGALMALPLDELTAALEDPRCERVPLDQVSLLSPITPNQQLIFQMGNYHSHLREVGVRDTHAARNVFFAKAASSLAPPRGQVRQPEAVALLDYEVELGLVMGGSLTAPTDIAAGELHRYVRAVTLVNDISARDAQIADAQYYLGKSHRGFCPVGPWLMVLEKAEFDQLEHLRLRLWVNGTLRQDANTSDMVHRPHVSLSQLSRAIDLNPGDLLATGTPGGCAIRAPRIGVQKLLNLLPDRVKLAGFVRAQLRSGRYLKAGDVITASITTADGRSWSGEQRTEVVA